MRTALMVAALLGLGACGGEDPTIDGVWISPINEACGLVGTFSTADGTYAAQFVCALQGGGFGSDLEVGAADFSVPGQVSLRPTRASCPSGSHLAETDFYSFGDEGQLVLATPGAVIIFKRPPPSGGASGAIALGCWTMGQFTPSPIRDL